jgi:hypothetical protein
LPQAVQRVFEAAEVMRIDACRPSFAGFAGRKSLSVGKERVSGVRVGGVGHFSRGCVEAVEPRPEAFVYKGSVFFFIHGLGRFDVWNPWMKKEAVWKIEEIRGGHVGARFFTSLPILSFFSMI